MAMAKSCFRAMSYSVTLLLLIVSLVGFVSGSNTLTLHLYSLEKYPHALCNDGSPSGYYFKAAANGSSPLWIVFQQGGDWCYDEVSCKARSISLTSSTTWSSQRKVEGLLDSQDSRLGNANLVFVPYCSSDGYIGNRLAKDVSFGWNFMGRSIVTALWDELITVHSLGKSPNTQIIYGGCSAGARGAMFNVNFVGDLLTTRLGSNLTNFGALLDSAFWVDIDPFDSSILPLHTKTSMAFNLINAASTAPPNCLSTLPPSNQWQCLFGQYLLPFLNYTFLLHEFEDDLFQLNSDGIESPPTTDPERNYVSKFTEMIKFFALKDVSSTSNNKIVLPGCFRHCNTEQSLFHRITVNGVTLEEAITQWFFDKNTTYFIDTCEGFDCGPGCHPP